MLKINIASKTTENRPASSRQLEYIESLFQSKNIEEPMIIKIVIKLFAIEDYKKLSSQQASIMIEKLISIK